MESLCFTVKSPFMPQLRCLCPGRRYPKCLQGLYGSVAMAVVGLFLLFSFVKKKLCVICIKSKRYSFMLPFFSSVTCMKKKVYVTNNKTKKVCALQFFAYMTYIFRVSALPCWMWELWS